MRKKIRPQKAQKTPMNPALRQAMDHLLRLHLSEIMTDKSCDHLTMGPALHLAVTRMVKDMVACVATGLKASRYTQLETEAFLAAQGKGGAA